MEGGFLYPIGFSYLILIVVVELLMKDELSTLDDDLGVIFPSSEKL